MDASVGKTYHKSTTETAGLTSGTLGGKQEVVSYDSP